MRRRRFLAMAGVGFAPGLTGCTATDLPTLDDERHPLADATATVRVENRSTTDHDVEANAREALAFWEKHSEQYAGFEVEFEVVDGSADIVIAYADDPRGCEDVENYSQRVLGCAPLVRPGNAFPDSATIQVVAGARPFGSIRTTTKHEIGHVLGLGHDDEPRNVMSDRAEDRVPLYDVRVEILETVLAGRDRASEATAVYNLGIESWNGREYGTASGRFREARRIHETARERFERARDRSTAFEDEETETVDLEGLRSHLDRLIRRMELGADASGLMAEASEAAGEDDADRANDLLAEANERTHELRSVESTQVRDVAIALGLVRAFDNDDAVVEPVEET